MKQTIKSKKAKIDDAVRVFREALEKTYLKKDSKNEFRGIGISNLTDVINGNYSRTGNKDLIKMQISFSAKEVVKNEISGIPMKFSDWKLFPILIFLHSTDEFIDVAKEEKNDN